MEKSDMYVVPYDYQVEDNRAGIQVVISSGATESSEMCGLRAVLVTWRSWESHLLMTLLHEDELFPHPLNLLFQGLWQQWSDHPGSFGDLQLNF